MYVKDFERTCSKKEAVEIMTKLFSENDSADVTLCVGESDYELRGISPFDSHLESCPPTFILFGEYGSDERADALVTKGDTQAVAKWIEEKIDSIVGKATMISLSVTTGVDTGIDGSWF